MLEITNQAMDPRVYKAAKNGNIRLLRDAVESNSCSLLKVTPQGNTTLHVSVRFGHLDFIKEMYAMLLQHNTSLEGNTEYSRSLSLLKQVNLAGDAVLHIAIREGHNSVANFFIEKIINWDCESCDHDLEAETISFARETIRIRNKIKNTALHEAVRRNDVEMVESLIKADPHLSHFNYDADKEGTGESPLYMATRYGHLEIIQKMLAACPFAAYGGPKGRTVLHLAVIEERLDVVKALIEKNMDMVHGVDENGRTALHYAMTSKECEEIARLLLSYDACDVYKWDKEGFLAIHIAALKSTASVLEELIQRYPDSLELLDNTKHRNVLHFAVMSRDLDKVKCITECQSEFVGLLNQADNDGNTPLHLAAKQLTYQIVKHLAASNIRGVFVDAENNDGQKAVDMMPILYIMLMGRKLFRFERQNTSFQMRPGNGRRGKWILRGPKEGQYEKEKESEAVIISEKKKMMNKLQIVASLIATVTFAAVFQVPGGYNSNDGTPVLVNQKSFRVFLMCDALALCTSISSLTIMVMSSFTSSMIYISRTMSLSTNLLIISLVSTSIAFVGGFSAVLPHCSQFLCFTDQSTITFSVIALFVIIIMYYFPIRWFQKGPLSIRLSRRLLSACLD